MNRSWQFWQSCAGISLVLLLIPFTVSSKSGTLHLFDSALTGMPADALYAMGFFLAFPAIEKLVPLRRPLEKRPGVSLAAAHAAFVSLYLAGCLISPDTALAAIRPALIFIAGAAAAAIWTIWGAIIVDVLSLREIRAALIVAFVISALLNVPISVANVDAWLFNAVGVVAPAVGSCACYALLSRGRLADDRRAGEDAPAAHLAWPMRVALLAVGFVASAILCIVHAGGQELRLGGVGAFLISAVLVLLLLRAVSSRIGGGSTTAKSIRITLLVTSAFLFAFVALRHALPGFWEGVIVQTPLCYLVTLLTYNALSVSSASREPFSATWSKHLPWVGCGYALALLLSACAGALACDPAELMPAACIMASALALSVQPAIGNDVREFIQGGFLESETPEQNRERLEAEFSSRFQLTPREGELLVLLGKGLTYRLIANQMGISEATVGSYVKRLYAKCNVHSRGELINLLYERNT